MAITIRWPNRCNKTTTCTCPNCVASWRATCCVCGQEVHPSKIHMSGSCDTCVRHMTIKADRRKIQKQGDPNESMYR